MLQNLEYNMIIDHDREGEIIGNLKPNISKFIYAHIIQESNLGRIKTTHGNIKKHHSYQEMHQNVNTRIYENVNVNCQCCFAAYLFKRYLIFIFIFVSKRGNVPKYHKNIKCFTTKRVN